MIDTKIHSFYEQYKANTRAISDLEKGIYEPCAGKEEWLTKIQMRSQILRFLCVKNESMISETVSPILTHSKVVDEDTAQAFLKEIEAYLKSGFLDTVVTCDVLWAIIKYYERINDRDNLIRSYFLYALAHEASKTSTVSLPIITTKYAVSTNISLQSRTIRSKNTSCNRSTVG